MTAFGLIDGWCDATLGLPSQAANRFAAHYVLRDDADWRAYCESYVDSYLKTIRSNR